MRRLSRRVFTIICLFLLFACTNYLSAQNHASMSEFSAVLLLVEEKLQYDDAGSAEEISSLFTKSELEKLRRHAKQLEPVVLHQLKEGGFVGATLVAKYLRFKSAVPILKERLLMLRNPYGWEGPDYSKEESYLTDYQYPHHMLYISAIESISRLSLKRAAPLTEAERKKLVESSSQASMSTGKCLECFCAKWLLRKYSEQ